ncbi:MAG: omptin family outer membrane protease, partial [Spirochaetaceae bacterium]|nr:omptin family outer membrane protease [Spirochaetaceae bacterium]
RLGFSLPAGYGSFVNFFGFVLWNHFSWLARDGYRQYCSVSWPPPWTPAIPKDYDRFRGEKVIRYTQDWIIPGLGLSLSFPLSENFEAGASVLASPLLLVIDKDQHILRDLVFRDYLAGGFFFETSIFLAVSFSPRTRLLVKSAYRGASGSRGNAYIYDTNDVFMGSSADTAGANMSYGSVEFVFEWLFPTGA